MKFKAEFTRDELITFASQWLPLKLLLGGASKDDRYLLLSDPLAIELVPNKGLRIACRAQIRWPVLGMTVPINARELSVILRPEISERAGEPLLSCRIEIERADLSAVPARFDRTVTEAVNRALAERVKPSWNFGRMLTRSIRMPALLATTESIELAVRYGTAVVTPDAFVFELELGAGTTRRA